jgi:hypothetical protein
MMAPFSRNLYQGGYVNIDHSASPGMPAWWARRHGYLPHQVAEGSVYEADTYGCPHCGGVVVKNPERQRPREICFKCNTFICDTCAAISRHPDYVHRLFVQLVEK